MRKVFSLVFLSFILFNCNGPLDFVNPVDPESDNYIGSESEDNDGDGIGQYEDVDEIELISPENGAVVDTVEPILSVYRFNPGIVKKYWIQISLSDSDFESSIVLDYNDFTSNECTVPVGKIIWDRIYYWRAIAFDGSKWSDNWSEVWSFTIEEGNIVPQNGGSTLDTTPLLNWPDTVGVSGYYLQVNTANDFGGTMVVDDDKLNTSDYQVSTMLSDNTTYYWHFKATNNDDVWGWGSTWSFSVDITPPSNPSPANGGNTLDDMTPLLEWEDITGAGGYHIQVNTDNGFGAGTMLEEDSTFVSSQYQVSTVLTLGNIYYWRVKTKNTDEVWGDWSDTLNFRAGYLIRDIGPAGGLVFYDKGSYSDGWRWLEAAPLSTEWIGVAWGHYGTAISGADGTAVGTGEQNTADIVAYLGTGTTYAAQLCYGLTEGGYNDWFLPSKDELALVYWNLKRLGFGGFASWFYYYWSSSEKSAYSAWRHDFYSDYVYQSDKDEYFNMVVRAVRAF